MTRSRWEFLLTPFTDFLAEIMDGATGLVLAATAAETFAVASIWRHKAGSRSKCVRIRRCGAVLAPEGSFPQQVRT